MEYGTTRPKIVQIKYNMTDKIFELTKTKEGFGDITIITVGVISFIFPFVFNYRSGEREFDYNLKRVGNIIGYNKLSIELKIKIPAIFNYISTAFFRGIDCYLVRKIQSAS